MCGDVNFPAFHLFMTHMRLMHADEPQFVIQCNMQGCQRTFRNFTVYRNHVYAFHDTSVLDQDPSNSETAHGELRLRGGDMKILLEMLF